MKRFISPLYCANTVKNCILKQFENCRSPFQNETLHQERSQDGYKTLESCDIQTFDNQMKQLLVHI